ncbi:hypothetical protein BKA56DRAFT_622133 [Ilyonectria sp. MPI-CAGE-AT-0026]|nr:hypothetical protein BKA56DRAFT_622133 [Ilyonectria sp. MPI-CAGE-AT-0026]
METSLKLDKRGACENAVQPCYIKPEKLRRLVLAMLDALEGLSDDVIVQPNSIILGREGHFITPVINKKSVRGCVLRSVLWLIAPLTRGIHSLNDPRKWARRQLLYSLAAYAYAWSEQGVVDESGKPVSLEERVVLDPEVIISVGIKGENAVASSALFRKFLQDLKVVKASQVSREHPSYIGGWINAWRVQYEKKLVYTG